MTTPSRAPRSAQASFEYLLLLAGVLVLVILAVAILRGDILGSANERILAQDATLRTITDSCSAISSITIATDGSVADVFVCRAVSRTNSRVELIPDLGGSGPIFNASLDFPVNLTFSQNDRLVTLNVLGKTGSVLNTSLRWCARVVSEEQVVLHMICEGNERLAPTPLPSVTPTPTPIPSAAPVTLVARVHAPSISLANVTFNTSRPCNATLEYGTLATVLDQALPVGPENASEYNQTLQPLSPSRPYFYNLTLCDGPDCWTYGPFTFTTLPSGILLENVTFSSEYSFAAMDLPADDACTNQLCFYSSSFAGTAGLSDPFSYFDPDDPCPDQLCMVSTTFAGYVQPEHPFGPIPNETGCVDELCFYSAGFGATLSLDGVDLSWLGWDAPVVELASPDHGKLSYPLASTFRFVASAPRTMVNATLFTDEGAGFAARAVTYSVGNGTQTSIARTVAAGPVTWNVFVCDNVGQCRWADANFTFFADTAPWVVLQEPQDSANVSSGVLGYTFTVNSHRALKNASLWNNASGPFAPAASNASALTPGANFTIPYDTDPGRYLWNVHACDLLGRCYFSEFNRSVRAYLNADPTLYQRPCSQMWSGTQAEFGFRASDDLGIANVSLYLDGGSGWHLNRTVTPANHALTRVNLSTGASSVLWNVKACDLYGKCVWGANQTLNRVASQVVSCCQTLRTPHTYTFDRDLTADDDSVACLELDIPARNAVLDGAGHAVRGSSAYLGLRFSGENFTVKDLTLDNLGTSLAVYNWYSAYSTLWHVNVTRGSWAINQSAVRVNHSVLDHVTDYSTKCFGYLSVENTSISDSTFDTIGGGLYLTSVNLTDSVVSPAHLGSCINPSVLTVNNGNLLRSTVGLDNGSISVSASNLTNCTVSMSLGGGTISNSNLYSTCVEGGGELPPGNTYSLQNNYWQGGTGAGCALGAAVFFDTTWNHAVQLYGNQFNDTPMVYLRNSAPTNVTATTNYVDRNTFLSTTFDINNWRNGTVKNNRFESSPIVNSTTQSVTYVNNTIV